MKKENKERGFSTIAIILFALVLGGGVVFAVKYIVETEKITEPGGEKITETEREKGTEAGTERITGEEEVKGPQDVVEAFYTWYISYEGHPLVDEAYEESPYLTSTFKRALRNNNTRGFDPVLCAQDIPPVFEVGEVSISGAAASVNLIQAFGDSGRVVPVELEKVNGEWLISDVGCSEAYYLEDEEDEEKQTVVLYYSNEERTPEGVTDCGLVYGVEREIELEEDILEAKLNALFAGPTEEEQAEGYSSFFSQETADILIGVKVEDSTTYVNLKDIRDIIPSANASCASQNFFASVEETLTHDRAIEDVIFAINGDPETFYEWMQIGCTEENNFCDPTPFEE